MYSKLPAAPGDTPTKVVFEGVGDQDKARALYAQHAGTINAFQSKARQQRMVSEQPGHHAHQQLPNGGHMRYVYNTGQETIYVKLAAHGSNPSEQPEPGKPKPYKPKLAIDVLFQGHAYRSVNVFIDLDNQIDSYESGGPFSPENYDTLDGIEYYEDETQMLTFYGSFPGVFLNQEQIQFLKRQVEGSSPLTTTIKMISLRVPLRGVDTNPFRPGPSYDPASNGTQIWFVLEYKSSFKIDTSAHDTIDVFDTFIMVGVVGAPESKQPYEACSPGRLDWPDPDERLKPVDTSTATAYATRAVAMDTYDPGTFGMGFIAEPAAPYDEGTGGVKTEFDIYLASINSAKHNDEDEIGASVAGDSPKMEYDYDDRVAFMIRLREFADYEPVAVKVQTTTEMHVEHSQTNVPVNDHTEKTSSGRVVTWGFAAKDGWSDAGGEVADPYNNNMGALLTYQGKELCVTGPQETRRGPVYSAPEWHGSVRSMTKVARVTWHPPDRMGTTGTATIEMYDGIQCNDGTGPGGPIG